MINKILDRLPAARPFVFAIASLAALVVQAAITVDTTKLALPDGAVGESYLSYGPGWLYFETIPSYNTFDGGTSPYTIAVKEGTTKTLPPGMSFYNSSNVNGLSGTPTTPGYYEIEVTITDANNESVEAIYTITIIAPPFVVDDSKLTLANGEVGKSYSAYLFGSSSYQKTFSGGVPPYTVAVKDGTDKTLPPGLSILGSGTSSIRIYGTPTTAGSYETELTVSDSGDVTTNITYSITIEEPALEVVAGKTTLDSITQHISASINLAGSVTGGTAPYSYVVKDVDGNNLPTGLSLSNSGVISGTPTVAGEFSFIVTVSDSATTPPIDVTYSLSIVAPDPITAATSLTATVGNEKSFTLADTISGGVPPYTFALKSGSNAPNGFTLVDGVLSGTAAAAVDSYSFTVIVTDAIETAQEITYTFSASEYAGFTDDDPEEPASGVSVDCRTADGVMRQRTCHQLTSSDTTWSDSWYYVTGEVSIPSVVVNGKVSLILGDGATLTVQGASSKAGIRVAVEGSVTNSLTIYCQGAGTGKLVAKGGSAGAGIGGDNRGGSTGSGLADCGKVTIYGGVIEASGSGDAAGIGGGDWYGKGGTVAIYGGSVTASAGSNAAGVGRGYGSSTDNGTLTVGERILVKAGNSANPTTVLDHGEGGAITLSSQKYFTFEMTGPTPLAQTTNALVAHVGEAFEQALSATVSGGTPSYTFTQKSGTLPDGLTFNDGVISGTPTVTATETVVFTVTDSGIGAESQNEDFSYTVTVTYPPKTITYKDGNNTINGLSPTEYAPGTATALAASATKTGYTFAGWYDNAECTGSAVTEVSASETENKTYWAKWTPVAYSIVYMDGTTPMDGLTPTTYTIEAAATLPETATKAGYGFYGWYDNSACTGDAVTTIPAGQTGTKTFYAKWGVIKTNETYIDGSGNEQIAECATITSSSTSLSAGWYIVKEDVTISQKVTVSGAVNLILADGATLTVACTSYDPAIEVKGESSLSIYVQELGTGALVATSSQSVGIGSNDSTYPCGTVTIYGGNITVTGSHAGIGGGWSKPGGTVYVYGGNVTANGGGSSAGIGGAGTGYKNTGSLKVGENVIVKAKASDSYGQVFVLKSRADDGTITLGGEQYYKIITPPTANLAYRDTDGTTKYQVCTLLSDEINALGDGWYAVTNDLSFGTLGMSVSGSANLVIADGASLVVTGATEKAGINVPVGSSLTIFGQADNSGVVSAVGGGNNYTAGIGGNKMEACGTVIINGGTVVATGKPYGAGIGGGYCNDGDPSVGAGGTVIINGGIVTAQGGSYAAGIGGGQYGNGGTVTVNGGTVTAVSGNSAASGIGKGAWGTGAVEGTLTVSSSMSVMAGANAGSATKQDRNETTGAIALSGQQYFFIERVGPAGLVQTTNAFAAYVGQAFEQTLSATVSGGTPSYTFMQKSGTLPTGLLFENGVISGTPTATASETVVFTVTDSGVGADNQSEDFTYTITVTQPPKTITYKDGENTINGLSPAEYAPGVGATLPTTAPAATGYELEGWYETAACDGEKVTAVSAEATDNKTFYAKWTPIVYTVTYMDGSTPITDQGLIPTSYTIESADLSLPATATKTGKGFYGWYGTSACTGDAVTTITHGSTGNKIFYAKWGAVQSNEAYVDAGGNEMPAQLCTVIASDTTTLSNGWYVAKGDVTISESVTVSGDVNLILADGAHLEVTVASGSKSALNVASGNSLTIYAQANGTGRLDATGAGSISSGIGGNSSQVCGTITVNGGTIVATGGTGIGSGYNIGSVAGGAVIINGGRVTATSASEFSAGIGSVKSADNQGTLTVGANVVVKAGASSTLTDSDIKNPNGETSIPLTTIYRYYQVEKPGPTPLTQTTSAFAAVVGQAFEQSIAGTISGGTAPYTFTLKSQTLSEKGLAYENGVISGTPNATGTATVTITVSDAAIGGDHQSEDFTYTVTVTYPPKSITYVDSRDGTTELTGLVPAQYTPGTAATLPTTATAPTGYNFAGWYTNAACTGDEVTTVSTAETENKTFYAKWTPRVYTITYKDGSTTLTGLEPTTYTIESADITLPPPATKLGYDFVSWHTTSALTGSAVTTIPHGSFGNRTFYSKWIAAKSNESYIDADGNPQTELASPLDSATTSLETGWYIVKGNVAINSTVTVTGDVKLILADGCSLTVTGSSNSAGIRVIGDNSLTIYAQENGTGSLTATVSGSTSDCAGIGGNSGETCGTVTIYSGNVTARSNSQYGAGIGGGRNGSGGTVTVYGGTVTAQAQYISACGAGIGSGGSGSSYANIGGGTVTIYGGTVTAESNYDGAGIGSGKYNNNGCTVTIYGGTVTATSTHGGAGIGGGMYGKGGSVTVNGGTVTATAGNYSYSASYVASGIGKGYGIASSYPDGTLTVGDGMKAYAGASANPTDELGESRSFQYYVVKVAPLAQSVSALEAGAGEECTIDLAATVLGGSGTYTFAVKAGSSLPAGLEISGTTLSGTVSSVGEYTFTLVVTDTTTPTPQTIDAAYTLTVKLPGFIDEEPVEPTGGDTVTVACRNADGKVRQRTCHPVVSDTSAVTWEDSWYYVTGNVTLSKGAIVSGKVSLVLADGATLTVIGTTSTAGIAVTNGNSIVIYGQTEGTGALNASSGTSSSYYASGIGGNRGDNGNMKGECGNIVICGGHITAQGGYYGAGIGGGYYGGGGTVTIYGGTITAIGGYNGAGIGGGQYKNGGTVTIYDGTITANGGTNGAGIGGGSSAAGGRVDVYGGNIEATGGSGSYTVGIGRGNGSNKTNGAGLYVYNDDAVIKYSSNASYTLNPITPNATTHKVDLGTSSSYKYVRITGPIPMAQKTTSLEAALTGQLKSWTLATATYSSYIRDGKMPYTFDPEHSTLPEGFSLTAEGVLSGRPSAAGNYEFNIAVTDSNPSSTNFTFTLTVNDPNPITVATTDYGSKNKGTNFYQTIQPTGGVSPYTFSAAGTTLPPGITCYTEAGVGVLSGTLYTAGDYEFTITVTDSALPANVQPITFHLTVKDVYPITYYDADGETTLSLSPATYVQDAGVATLPTPIKDGSAFLHWYANKDLTGAPVTSIPSTSTGPVALYSKWYTPVSGNIEVTFNGADGEQTETCTVITPSMAAYDSTIHSNTSSSNITLSTGWYVVANIDTLPQKVSIVINGEVNLVLMDDRSLTVTKPAYHKSSDYLSAIVLTSGNTLNVYGQTKGTGTLTANGFNGGAGIGGCAYNGKYVCGTLRVYGGTVVANGGSGSAGIGGGAHANGAGGTVEIHGGTVTATGANGGAGIGGGGNLLTNGIAADGGTVKIYGGTVTATGSAFSYSGPRVGAGAGIGGGGGAGKGGNGGTVEIYNGVVTAIGGVNESASAAGIGGGNGADSEGTLKVSGQYAVVYAGDDASSATERTPGANDMVALDGSPYYEIQGEGAAPVTYDITYMSNGESQYWLEPNIYTHGTAQTLAEAPDPREGYTFDGWFVDDQFNGDPVVEVPANATGDKTFYAKWTPVVYTITYYSIVGDEKTELTGLVPATYTIESGATLPTEIGVVREGWVFEGWCSYTSGPQVTQIAPGTTGNKTFYVRWDLEDFGLFDGEIYLDACVADSTDLTETIHKGTAPYTFALKDMEGNELPNGLTLNSNGTLSGSPTAAGVYEVVIVVTDSSEPQRSIEATYMIEVMLSKTTGTSGPDASLLIGCPTTINLAQAIVGGTAPYTFELVTDWEDHGLPSGLVLNGNKLEGTPTFRGTSTFALNVTDANNYSSYLYYTIYSQSDTAQRTDTVNGIEWGYVKAAPPKEDGRITIWNSTSLSTDGTHAIPVGTTGCVYVPDGSCLWTGHDPVTVIGRNAFKNCAAITRVTLSDDITDIGENAFDGCTALKAVMIPSSGILEHINTNAFAGATALERIYVCKGDKESFTALLEASGYEVTDENLIVECDFYTLTLDTNLGDELEMPVLKKAYIESALYLPNVGNLPVPTRNNYTFDGWYTEKFGGIRINEDDTLSGGDWTLYAHWTTTMPDPVFTIDGNGVLTDVTLNGHTEIAIPDTVTSIGDRAFDGLRVSANKNLLRVVIPGTVENIGWRAFDECTKLREVNIPSGVTNIAQNAFRLCVSLESVDIPGSVETIGTSAFANCSNLVSVTIGDGVRNIGQSAFGYCTSLACDDEQGFYIPDSVQTIGSGAFHGVRFEKASLPGTLYSEGDPVSAQFSNVSTLTKITVTYRDLAIPVFKIINGSLRSVQLNGNTEVTIPDGVTEIFIDAFSGLSEMTSVTIPTTVTNIWANAFEGCSGLTEITIPDSVTRLSHPFRGCTGLKSLTVPDSVTDLDLWNCSNLVEVVVGSGVTEVSETAFSSCTSLERVTFNGNLTWINQSAFWNCYALKEINFPDTLRYIGLFAFMNCTSLESVTIPKFVTVERYAFSGCTSLKQAKVGVEATKKKALLAAPRRRLLGTAPETTTIGERAFSSCTRLEEVTLGSTVSDIGGGAFSGCPKLKSITVEAGNENYSSVNGLLLKGEGDLVSACGTATSINVPSGVTNILHDAFADYTTLTSVTLPSGLTTIGEAAFSNATRLATATIPDGVGTIGTRAFYGTDLKTVCVESPDYIDSLRTKISGSGYNTTGVSFFAPSEALPSVDKPLEEADNGLPNWQNYVLGQDSDEPVKVEGVSAATESSVTIASTLKTPTASTGFTVKYSIDQVSADGAVVSEGEKQTSSALSIDLESITTNAFFTMKATIVNDATGAEVPVTTENVIGVMVVTNAPATTIIGVPFKSLSDDGSISVSNLVQTANLSEGDELKAFGADGKLHSWTLTNGVWEPVIVQEEGQAPVMSEDADKIKLARGKGVWLTRKDPTKPIYFVGEASVEAAETELDVATDEAPKAWNMVAPPSVEPVKLNDVFTVDDGSTIQVPPAREGGIPRNYTFKNGKWGYDGSENGIPKRIESDTLPSGRGFWYINKSKDPNKKINW